MADRTNGQADLTVRAPAKVNLCLEVLGKRPDGFHEIRTVMQAVSLCDELEFRRRPDGHVGLSCSDPQLPVDERNLAVRAARLLQQRLGVQEGVDISLRKRVPVGGGLGGGSSDGAVTLLALRELWRLDITRQHLADLAAELGSDVPFFLWGGAAQCEGRGERVSPLACSRPMHYVLVMPSCAVSTAQVYEAAKNGLTTSSAASKNVSRALREGDAALLGASLRNDLQDVALSVCGDLLGIWRRLQELKAMCGAEGLLLSGSGSSFLVVFRGARQANRAGRILSSGVQVPCAAVHSLPGWHDRFSLLTAERRQL